jgi:hypothetical protein
LQVKNLRHDGSTAGGPGGILAKRSSTHAAAHIDEPKQAFMSPRYRWFALILLLSHVPAGAAASAAAEPVTFCRDVAPILYARCAGCHRPGEVAPFNLLTYDNARTRARQIRDVTRSRFMPPWLPKDGDYKFQGDRRLSDSEIELLS